MSDDVTLIGLDFGTTTSSAVVASARLIRSGVSGRRELADVRERFRSEMAFTPLDADDRIDEAALDRCLDNWFQAGDVRIEDVFGGGALLTGLTARRENAESIVRLVRRRLRESLIATADDPRLESWLAFMGSCAALSRERAGRPILNFDIGGGTTNVALGIDGEVLRTGCLFVGARHVQVVPGTYRIVRLSSFANRLFEETGIRSDVGESLSPHAVDSILSFYVQLLEGVATGRVPSASGTAAELHVQVPLRCDETVENAAIVFSGGVGELIYARADGLPWPPVTCFGDLGVDLAQRLAASPVFGPHIAGTRPAAAGRATVYGLLRHSTDASGATLYLPRPEMLPLAHVPIFGRLDASATEERVRELLELVRHSPRGGAIQVSLGSASSVAVRSLGEQIRDGMTRAAFPADLPLVLLVCENLGNVLGQYVTRWGTLPFQVVVVDELAIRDAQYVQIGSPRSQVVPVSLYGLNEPGEKS